MLVQVPQGHGHEAGVGQFLLLLVFLVVVVVLGAAGAVVGVVVVLQVGERGHVRVGAVQGLGALGRRNMVQGHYHITTLPHGRRGYGVATAARPTTSERRDAWTRVRVRRRPTTARQVNREPDASFQPGTQPQTPCDILSQTVMVAIMKTTKGSIYGHIHVHWEFITRAIPQGSILETLLFILCLNRLPGID